MRSILVVNPKGGCGKTTIATNLATYYSVWGMSTASMDWLRVRPKEENPIQGFNGLKGKIYPDADTERVIYDCPARTDSKKVARLIGLVDVVIIPVMPSAIDMRVAASFIADIVGKIKASNSKAIMGVVANRAQKNYHSYEALEKFLKALDLPFVGALRNSQNYVKAAGTGVGIFEVSLSEAKQDMKEWEPILKWVEGKRKL